MTEVVDITKKDAARRKRGEGSQENEKRFKYFVETIYGEGGPSDRESAGQDIMNVLNSLPFYAMLIDSEHNILFANNVVSKSLGVEPEQIIGKYCPKVVHGLNGPYPGCPLEESVEKGNVAIEKEFFDEDQGMWYISAVYPTGQKTKKGKMVFFHTTRDITERKQTENELVHLKEFNERVINGIADAISVVNVKDFRIAGVNEAFLDICGLTEEEVIGKTCYEVTHHRDSPCLAPDDPCPIEELLETGKPTTEEHVHLDKDNRKTSVDVSAHPLYEGGEIKQIVHIAKDVTERKKGQEALAESEQLFKGIFDNATDGILLTDIEDKKFFTANETMCQMLGYGLEEIGSLGIMDIHPEENLAYVIERFEKQTIGEIILAEDIPVKRKDSSVFYADVNSSPVTIAGKTYRMGIFRDVTERKKTELKLKDAYDKLKIAHEDLKSLDKLKSDIISNVTHELRTPITIAGGALELAREEKNKKNRDKFLKLARDSLMHQDFIVDDLIDAASMVGGKRKLKSTAVNLADAISFIRNEFEPIAASRNIELDVSLKIGLPLVRVNYMQLHRVLRNLTNNAIKFNQKGGKVVIKADRKDDMVEVCVKDTGIGIDAAELEKIFDRLYQIDASSTRQYGGTGMGLAVVKETIEGYGGEIRVESELGRGSKFCFTLPIAPSVLI
jgi:PAS domain S-box-containing protein